jgi:hypothetical protein
MTEKRNFIMHRNLCGLTVQQRTKDGLFDASGLIQQWNKQNPNQSKLKLSDFFRLESTKVFLDELIKIKTEEISEKRQFNPGEKSRLPDNQAVTELDTKKSFKLELNVDDEKITLIEFRKGKTNSKGEKTTDTCYMDGLLFTKLAFFINPRFEARTIKWIHDNLILNRNKIADSYKEWSKLIAKLGGKCDKENNVNDFSTLQKCMNYAVFGYHKDDIRSEATEEQMEQIRQYEQMSISLYEIGSIKTVDDLKQILKTLWQKNFPTPSIFQ